MASYLATVCSAVVFLFAISAPVVARADLLDDDLQTAWEVLWDQRGTPRYLIRWLKTTPVKYRIFGADHARHKTHIQSAVDAVAQASGLKFEDVSDQPDAQNAQLDLEVVTDAAIDRTMPCFALPRSWKNWTFTKVEVKMRTSDTWRCALHEMMHAVGLPGHPSGKTVLSYFPYRQDVLSSLDKVMLRGLYAEMPNGATPFQAIEILSRYVVLQDDLGISITEAAQRRDLFLKNTVLSMEKFAQGGGEVPVIVRRSGRASENHIKEARNEIAYFLGLAHSRGTIVEKNEAQSVQWFLNSAKLSHQPSQVMAGRAYFYGRGVAIDKKEGLQWLDKAAAAGSTVAKDELAQIEKTISAEDLGKLRASSIPQ